MVKIHRARVRRQNLFTPRIVITVPRWAVPIILLGIVLAIVKTETTIINIVSIGLAVSALVTVTIARREVSEFKNYKSQVMRTIDDSFEIDDETPTELIELENAGSSRLPG